MNSSLTRDSSVTTYLYLTFGSRSQGPTKDQHAFTTAYTSQHFYLIMSIFKGNITVKKIKYTMKKLAIGSLTLLSLTQFAQATEIKVEVSNLFAAGGLALTPVWAGFHNGTFDTFDLDSAASSELQALAENGDMSGIRASFAASSTGVDGAVFGPEGFPGAPVIEPGEVTSAYFSINNIDSGYFSFLSMLIPTNDAFIGNDRPDQYSLFDMLGKFVGLDILVLGSQVWDSGTELNTGFGSPFLVGAGAQGRQDENSVVSVHAGLQILSGGLSIIGGSTPAGYTIDALAADFTAAGFQVARIKISEVTQVSAPAFGVASAFLLGLVLVRRKA